MQYKNIKKFRLLVAAGIMVISLSASMPVYAWVLCGAGSDAPGSPAPHPVKTSIDLGCSNQGNPIMDLIFAIIRLLSAGVGIAVVASVVVAGIQFSAARSDPQAVAGAITRLRSTIIALIIFIFAYAILNYVVPGGFFK